MLVLIISAIIAHMWVSLGINIVIAICLAIMLFVIGWKFFPLYEKEIRNLENGAPNEPKMKSNEMDVPNEPESENVGDV